MRHWGGCWWRPGWDQVRYDQWTPTQHVWAWQVIKAGRRRNRTDFHTVFVHWRNRCRGWLEKWISCMNRLIYKCTACWRLMDCERCRVMWLSFNAARISGGCAGLFPTRFLEVQYLLPSVNPHSVKPTCSHLSLTFTNHYTMTGLQNKRIYTWVGGGLGGGAEGVRGVLSMSVIELWSIFSVHCEITERKSMMVMSGV